MVEAFTSCGFAKSHFWRIIICFFTLRSHFERLSGFIGTEGFSHTQGDVDLWHLIVITNFHLISINWHSILSTTIITSRVAILGMIDVNTVNIFLMWNDSIIKVYWTCWSFAHSVNVFQFVLKLARIQLLFILIKFLFISFLIVVIWFSDMCLVLCLHSPETSWCVNVFPTLLL